MTAPKLTVPACQAATLTTLTPAITVDPGGEATTVTVEVRLAPDTPEGSTVGGPNVLKSATSGPIAVAGVYAPTLNGLTPARVYQVLATASNASGSVALAWECSTTGATVAAVPPGGDDRLYNIAVILKELVESCLEPRCFPTSGVFPARPEAPCDLLGVYLDQQPITQDPEFADQQPCAAGEFIARFVILVQRCCAVPEPVITEAGQILQWVNVAEMAAVTKRLSRDLMSVYQCVMCHREELFGYCAPVRVAGVSTQVDSCYAHEIVIEVPIASDCCAGGNCP